MEEFFGDLERIAADLYPYRWPIIAGVAIILAAVAAFCYHRGWHMLLWRHKLPVAIVGMPLLALTGFITWDLGSPLFTNKTVEEEFPFAFSAVVPPDMEREDVEKIMAGIAKIDQEDVREAMPEEILLRTKADEAPSGQTPEQVATQPTAVKLKTGNFTDQDSFHKGSGQATIYLGTDGSYLPPVGRPQSHQWPGPACLPYATSGSWEPRGCQSPWTRRPWQAKGQQRKSELPHPR